MSDYKCRDCNRRAPEVRPGDHDLTDHADDCAGVARGVLILETDRT